MSNMTHTPPNPIYLIIHAINLSNNISLTFSLFSRSRLIKRLDLFLNSSIRGCFSFWCTTNSLSFGIISLYREVEIKADMFTLPQYQVYVQIGELRLISNLNEILRCSYYCYSQKINYFYRLNSTNNCMRIIRLKTTTQLGLLNRA
jgi:hypothetical protein